MEHAPLREERGVLAWHIPPPDHFLMPDSAASTCQLVEYAQLGQVPKAPTLPIINVSLAGSVFY